MATPPLVRLLIADASENRAFTSPSDYLDACASLQLLAERWEAQLGSLTVDAAALTRSKWPRGERFERAMQRLAEVINLNRQKIELVQKQVNLRIQAQGIPRDKQADFWQANFQNLRQQIRDLDARKVRLLNIRLAQN